MTRRSIILVACGVLTVLVGIAVALLSPDQSTPSSPTVVAADADGGADPGATSGAPEVQPPSSARPEVPAGTEAVAVEATFVAGGAGFVAAGDRVNVFALVDGPAPAAVAVLGEVEVLEASASGGSGSASNPKQVTFVLAVPVDRVDAVVRAAGFSRLYVTVPSEENAPRSTADVGASGQSGSPTDEVAP